MIKTNIVERTQTYKFDGKQVKVEYKDGLLDKIILIDNDNWPSDYFYFKSRIELEETIENLQAILKDINNG